MSGLTQLPPTSPHPTAGFNTPVHWALPTLSLPLPQRIVLKHFIIKAVTLAGQTSHKNKTLTVPLCPPQIVWHCDVSIGVILLPHAFRPFSIFKSFPPKIIIEERSETNVITMCFKCEYRSIILCLVSKPSTRVQLGRENKIQWVGQRNTKIKIK